MVSYTAGDSLRYQTQQLQLPLLLHNGPVDAPYHWLQAALRTEVLARQAASVS